MNIEDLKKIAESATWGEWTHQMGYISAPAVREDGKGGTSFHVAMILGWGHLQYLGFERAEKIQNANGEYIATFSPSLIIKLLYELIDARELIEYYADVQNWRPSGRGLAIDWFDQVLDDSDDCTDKERAYYGGKRAREFLAKYKENET